MKSSPYIYSQCGNIRSCSKFTLIPIVFAQFFVLCIQRRKFVLKMNFKCSKLLLCVTIFALSSIIKVETTTCCWPYKVVVENGTMIGYCDDQSIAEPCCSTGSGCSVGCCFCDPCRNATTPTTKPPSKYMDEPNPML